MARPENKPKTLLAARLRDVRKQLGDPERGTLVDALGVSVGAISRYERGENEPTAAVIARYKEAFGVSFHWLLTGEGEMFADPSKAPVSKELHTIKPDIFRAVGKLVGGLHKAEGINLPPDALLNEQSSAYNALIERAENPGDLDELQSLLPWLEARLKRDLKAAKADPGTGKLQA
ncbi:MAG: helix-turn-helix transcriptional regulator [Roseibium sp.]